MSIGSERKVVEMMSEAGARHAAEKAITGISGRWLSAVWQVSDDGVVTLCSRVTWKFPNDAAEVCAKQLLEDLTVKPRLPLPDPLPRVALPLSDTGDLLGFKNSNGNHQEDAEFTMEDK
jgi:hypothetical protein